LPQITHNGASAPLGNAPSTPDIALPGSGEHASFDIAAADHKRLQAVQQVAHDIANVFIVGDKRFTIFKDVTGQYITRFTSLRDGRVTYIPEPEMLRMSSSGPSLNIKA
jgi:hypothetical protein